jgi:hypothetical protein
MALTSFQRRICRLIAEHRIESGEAYLAGGVALNALTAASRISRDIDLFHDTDAALQATWAADRQLLEARGFDVRVQRSHPSLVEAEVHADGESVRMEWARDSAFRFFPLVTHAELGVTLHPVDLATNKVLALVGRVEVRDWIDVITSHERIQPLGYLAWAACGKDPGFNPRSILDHAARTSRYSAAEVSGLAFEGDAPDAARLSRMWRQMLDEGRAIIDLLPAAQVGTCVLTSGGGLCLATPENLPPLVASGTLIFHHGRIRGALPRLTTIE